MAIPLQFVLLRIGTLYQDLWEFWAATHIKKKPFQEIFSYSEKGLLTYTVFAT